MAAAASYGVAPDGVASDGLVPVGGAIPDSGPVDATCAITSPDGFDGGLPYASLARPAPFAPPTPGEPGGNARLAIAAAYDGGRVPPATDAMAVGVAERLGGCGMVPRFDPGCDELATLESALAANAVGACPPDHSVSGNVVEGVVGLSRASKLNRPPVRQPATNVTSKAPNSAGRSKNR